MRKPRVQFRVFATIAMLCIFISACDDSTVWDRLRGESHSYDFVLQVFDLQRQPVVNAEIWVNGVKVPVVTGADGVARFTHSVVGDSFGLRVVQPDYMANVQHVRPAPGTDRLVLTAWVAHVGTTQTIDPTVENTIEHGGARVTIPSFSLVDAEGEPVQQPVSVTVTYLAGSQVRASGNFEIADNPDEILLSLGLVEIVAEKDGDPVDLAPGAGAQIAIPADTTDPISGSPPLWRRNPDSGLWELASSSWLLNEGEWVARVDAIATWNCDYPNRVTCIEGRVLGPQDHPMGGVVVSGAMSGVAANILPANTVQTSTTSSDGLFCMEVIPDSSLVLGVTCPGGAETTLSFDVPLASWDPPRCGGDQCHQLGALAMGCCFTDEDCEQGVCEQGVCTEGGGDQLGTGDIQVTLRWSSSADIDLHVTDPSGVEIYYGNRNSPTGGELDVDDIPICGGTGSHVENIYWPTGGAPSGTYSVDVVIFGDCGDTEPTDWTITTTILGAPQSYQGNGDSHVVSFSY